MFYINTKTLDYPLTESGIRAQFPNISFPVDFTPPEPYSIVNETLRPEYDNLREYVKEVAPALIDGKWWRQYEVCAFDIDTIKKNEDLERARLLKHIVDSTQAYLDTFAKTRNYDNILSLCTYATSLVEKFRIEGQYGVELRDKTWARLYELFNEIKNGTRVQPESFEDIRSELPIPIWPNE